MEQLPPTPEETAYRTELSELLRDGRQEGIFKNHLTTPPLLLCRLPPLSPITDIREPFTFSSEDALQKFPPFTYPSEKLSVGKEALVLIGLTQKLAAAGQISLEEILTEAEEFHPKQTQYLEEPLVRAQFHPRERRKDHRLKKIPLDEENDQGLTWSRTVQNDVKAFEKEMQAEKMRVPTDICDFLKEACRPPGDVDDSLLSEYKNNPHERISPPLLPWSTIKPLELPPLKDLTVLEPVDGGSNADLLDDIIAPIMAKDAILCSPSSSPSRFIQDISTSPPSELLLLPEDPKLEVPLMPLTPPPSTKHIHFSSVLASDVHVLPRWHTPTPQGEPAEETLLDSLVREDVEQLERELAQEQLQQEDSMRVPVPVMDFSIPKLPWKVAKDNPQKYKSVGVISKLQQQLESGEIRKWGGTKSIEIDLSWLPFTKAEAVTPRETIEDEEVVESFLVTEAQGVEAEEYLLRGIEFLGIRNLKDEEDILEYGAFEKSLETEIASEQISEPMDIHEKPQREGRRTVEDSFNDLIRSHKRKATANLTQAKKKNHPAERNVNVESSAASSLDVFMTLRGRALEPLPAPTIPREGRETSNTNPKAVGSIPLPALIAPRGAFPAPQLPSKLPLADYIVSTALLSQRVLFRHIKAIHPTARFIERDFSTPVSNGHIVPEADLILSPKTGLVATTVQRLRQRSLPCEAGIFASGADVKLRISDIRTRYERLLVVIQVPSKLVSRTDLEVVAGFFGFLAALGKECLVVPRVVEGGEEDVARWIVGSMNEHSYRLIEDETMWERFLRKVGLNAFAAQVVLGDVRLRELLTMDVEERRRRFDDIVGERVMARVNGVLEQAWGSAVEREDLFGNAYLHQ